MSALSIVNPHQEAVHAASSMTLAQMAEEYQCLLDTAEMVDEGTADRAELEQQIAVFQAELPAKLDRVHYALAFLESQKALAAAERKRLQAREARYERDAERLERYVVSVIERREPDRKGKRKIEGNTVTFSLRPSERVVLPEDESHIPADYKTAAVEMPARVWEQIAEQHPELPGLLSKQNLITKAALVKAALKEGVEIPGCDIEYRNNLKAA